MKAARITPAPAAPTAHTALVAAERFLAGFEGDSNQEGIGELLAQVRAAIDLTKPRAPTVNAQYPNQRWFFGDGELDSCIHGFGDRDLSIDLVRHTPDLWVKLAARGRNFDARIALDAKALRDLARRSLDAAHDLETHPHGVQAAQAARRAA